MEAKDKRNLATDKIKRLAASKTALANSDRDTSANITRKRKARSSVLPARNKQVKNTITHKFTQSYCMMFKKAEMTERNYK